MLIFWTVASNLSSYHGDEWPANNIIIVVDYHHSRKCNIIDMIFSNVFIANVI